MKAGIPKKERHGFNFLAYGSVTPDDADLSDALPKLLGHILQADAVAFAMHAKYLQIFSCLRCERLGFFHATLVLPYCTSLPRNAVGLLLIQVGAKSSVFLAAVALSAWPASHRSDLTQ